VVGKRRKKSKHAFTMNFLFSPTLHDPSFSFFGIKNRQGVWVNESLLAACKNP
jgi:hypothetical protein